MFVNEAHDLRFATTLPREYGSGMKNLEFKACYEIKPIEFIKFHKSITNHYPVNHYLFLCSCTSQHTMGSSKYILATDNSCQKYDSKKMCMSYFEIIDI